MILPTGTIAATGTVVLDPTDATLPVSSTVRLGTLRADGTLILPGTAHWSEDTPSEGGGTLVGGMRSLSASTAYERGGGGRRDDGDGATAAP